MTKKYHVAMRLAFGACLLVSQFAAGRDTLFTDNVYVLIGGALCLLCGVALWITASARLQHAVKIKGIADNGPFRFIRHPIYTSIYLFSLGLGLIFFSWLWFVVMAVFIPLWYLECRKEEREMAQLHGHAYHEYQNKTGMFLPKLRKHSNSNGKNK